jgi:hypothetical protein
LEKYKQEHGNDLKDQVQLALFDPPFNWKIGEHDRISPVDMKNLCKIAAHVLSPGGTVVMFAGLNQIYEYMGYLQEYSLNVELNGLVVTYATNCNFIFYCNRYKSIFRKSYESNDFTCSCCT